MFRKIAAAALLLAGCDAFPWLEQSVVLPDGTTVVRIMIRAGGEYRTTVENAHGSASVSHMAIAGPHRWTNFYLTSDHQFVTIEGGGDSARFDILPSRTPSVVPPPRMDGSSSREQLLQLSMQRTETSENWRYIGLVYRGGNGFAYYTPADAPECIPLLGAGTSIYRKKYQRKHSCQPPPPKAKRH